MSLDCDAMQDPDAAVAAVYAACAAATRLQQQRPEGAPPGAAADAEARRQDARCCIAAWMTAVDAPAFGAARSQSLQDALAAPAGSAGIRAAQKLSLDTRSDALFGAGLRKLLRRALFVALCRHWTELPDAQPARLQQQRPEDAAGCAAGRSAALQHQRPEAAASAAAQTTAQSLPEHLSPPRRAHPGLASDTLPVARWTPEHTVAELQWLKRHHGALTDTPGTMAFLASVLRRVARLVAMPESTKTAASRASLGSAAAAPPAHGRPSNATKADDDTIDLAEAVLAGLAVRTSAWHALERGEFADTPQHAAGKAPTEKTTHSQKIKRSCGQPPATHAPAEKAAWTNLRRNLLGDLRQAGRQASAQRAMISARQQCAVGIMMEIGWDKGVKRALHALERTGQEDAAIEFQALSYRPIERMETDPAPLVQAVLYVTCKALLAYQHGPQAAAWLREHAPCYAPKRPACCLDTFGQDQANTTFAIDYITDGLQAYLDAKQTDTTPHEEPQKRDDNATSDTPRPATHHEDQRLRSSARAIRHSHKRHKKNTPNQPAQNDLPQTLEDLLRRGQ